MSIENLAPYSPDTVYGQLTSPFTPKKITVNSHTPYDKTDDVSEKSEEVFGRTYFDSKPQAKIAFGEISNIKPNYEIEYSKDVSKEDLDLSTFSVSSFSDDKILKGALSNGYSVNESIVIQNAQSAYQRSALITKNAPEVLSTCSYRVF